MQLAWQRQHGAAASHASARELRSDFLRVQDGGLANTAAQFDEISSVVRAIYEEPEDEPGMPAAPPFRNTHSDALLRRLAEGWRTERPDAPRELLAELRTRLNAEVKEREAGDNLLRFTLELAGVRLSGARGIVGLVLGGHAWSEPSGATFGGANETGRHGLILVANDEALVCIREAPRFRCVVLTADKFLDLLEEPEPVELLTTEMRAQFLCSG